MTDLRYEAPANTDAAIALLAKATGATRVLAGGTDLLVQLHADMIEPELVVDIKRIPGLNGISRESNGWRFGATTTGMELIDHDGFAKACPGIVDGVKLIGSMQVKGRATVAGNLCNASPAADSVPPLMSSGVIATVVGPNGKRDIPVTEFTTGPGKTTLAKGEIVTSFFVPDAPPHSGSAYLRFTPRTEMDIAVVGVAVNITLDASGTCTAATMALGAVAEKALLVPDAAKALVGTKVDEAALDKLAEAASAACRPISDKRGTKVFRIKVAGVLAKRTAAIALQRAKGGAK
jgi:CO/xanthine dehydrogenase FAD-binding subunit